MRKVEIVDLQSVPFTPWFNDPFMMRECVQTLEGLNKLTRARSEYREFRPAPLNERVLAGLWYTDSYGQTSPVSLNPMGGRPLSVGGVKILQQVIARKAVQTVREFADQFRETDPQFSWGHAFGSGRFMPEVGMRCTHCKKPWTVADSTDAYVSDKDACVELDAIEHNLVGKTLAEVREIYDPVNLVRQLIMRQYQVLKSPRFIDDTLVPRYSGSTETRKKNTEGWACSSKDSTDLPIIDWVKYVVQPGDALYFDVREFIHLKCRTQRMNARIRLEIEKAFIAASLMCYGSVSLPNKYASEDYSGRWYLFETTHGLFRVGWRRHVISLLEMEEGKMEYNAVAFSQKTSVPDRHFDTYEELTQHLRVTYNPNPTKA